MEQMKEYKIKDEYVRIYNNRGVYTVEWKIHPYTSDFREIKDRTSAFALYKEYKSILMDKKGLFD